MAIGTVTLVLAGTVAAGAQISRQQQDRIRETAAVLGEVRREPDKEIPQDLWDKATCVIVIPSLKKLAFGFGGEYGKGWGFQIGGESIDLVLLVMHQRGMDKLLQDKVALGADASVAAGPVGRTAQAATDVQLNAEIVSYSRAQGLFAGIDVSGGVLKPDMDANRDLYGQAISAREVLTDGAMAPVAAEAFMTALRRESHEVARR
jgi:lipid-binding SYLF domain-containing protein